MNEYEYTEKIEYEAFLKAIPKTDLHVHLDGSLRLETLIELAREQKVELPSYTTSGLSETVFKKNYASLNEYLEGFAYTCAVMRNREAIERIAYELARDNQEEGVCYVEPRFAPQLFMQKDLEFEEIMAACNRGFRRAASEYNNRNEVREGIIPPFNYGIIVCAMRFFTAGFSPFYKNFFNAHSYSDSRDIINLASQELVKACVKLTGESTIPVVGIDLAGSEAGYPAENHRQAYRLAQSHFLHKTVHAGEAFGPESIFQAITILHADRIGHGFYLFDESKVSATENRAKAADYVRNLVRYIAEKRITVEVCPTSNLQTNPDLKNDIRNHPFGRMLAEKLSVSICTDNRLVSNTSVSRELGLVIRNFKITPHQLKNLIIYGFKRSFFPGTYLEKRDYVRGVLQYLERIMLEYSVI